MRGEGADWILALAGPRVLLFAQVSCFVAAVLYLARSMARQLQHGEGLGAAATAAGLAAIFIIAAVFS